MNAPAAVSSTQMSPVTPVRIRVCVPRYLSNTSSAGP
jgi:hypothetical protein